MPGEEPAEPIRRRGRAYDEVFLRGRQSGDAQDPLASGAGCQRRYSCPDAGRKRHRQRSSGAADSQTLSARPPHVSESELRGRSRRPAGKRIVRIRSRRVHRRNHAKPGKFELCNKGTILLDEIGEMPPLLQAKLLHVLQDQQFSRLGSRSVIKVDVRILAATNINIPEALANKRLREDLYYRLNAFTLQLPPLRERKEEIPILLKHFMSRMSEQYARPRCRFLRP